MDTKEIEFIQLIDHALELAEQMSGENQVEQLSNLIGALQTIKSRAIAGQLEPSRGSLTLGLVREVADWVDSLDSPLLKMVGAIDRYYQRHYDQ
ncbi:MAG: hypothetical protein VKJ24_05625 [Synechococcales bacterium]|nr:hypothetical protein [Synechococcales bacterium]